MLGRWLRRLVVLGLLGGAAWAVKKYLDGDAIPASEAGPGFPRPLPDVDRPVTAVPPAATAIEPEPITVEVVDPPAEPTVPNAEPDTTETAEPDPAADEPAADDGPVADPGSAEGGGAPWVAAAGGEEPPASHLVKAKLNSGIYHLPGMLNYDRTVPDRWYTTASAAEADGLRKAKR